ncbi:MAG: ester cyclase [Caldilineaceae bacterium]|nr:ester cyclase [Caldilineaceae bacterium]
MITDEQAQAIVAAERAVENDLTKANKILVRQLIEEVWNTGNYEQLDVLAAPAFAESTKWLNQMTRMAFPDCHDTIDDLIAEGDKVVVRWTMRGTHLGEWPAPWGPIPPTGKPVTFSAIHIFRFADGKIVERWAQVDTLGILQQINALPAR